MTPEQAAESILAGPPVSRKLQKRLGISQYLPPIGAAKIKCQLCGEQFWIGPKQKAVLAQYPDVKKACFECAAPHLHVTKGVQSTGGKGGGYRLQNGVSIIPKLDASN